MLSSYDVGSLPLRVEESVIRDGARRSQTFLSLVSGSDEPSEVFEEEVVNAFADKLRAGIDVPNYPQFRDMNEMYFELIRGVEKAEGGYVALGTPTARPGSTIPEVAVIKRNTSRIKDLTSVDRVRVKACVTGPYTLASFFPGKSPGLFEDLGRSLAEIVSRSFFDSKNGELALVCIDEPVLGFLNDPLLDYGSEGRESLRRAWGEICLAATSRGVETSMHLHDTSDDLFWDVERLDMVESHMDDPLYTLEATRRRLEETDKRLKASIAVTLFDKLIESHIMREGWTGEAQQRIGEIWTEIRHGEVDPFMFIDEAALMVKRLSKVVDRFGSERVPYAGPECGFGGWPSYDSAMECLRRVSDTVRRFNKNRS
jgi:5-methyltetrahydropteroyltriglutamate--homocysteine methyltransferase